jgi:alanine racemase
MNQPPSPAALAGGILTIDLAALVANWRTVAAAAPTSETGAVLKADAYGIGLEQAGTALAAAGCRTFFVALPDEGVRLRPVVPDAVIYVLDGLLPGAAARCAEADLRPVLGSVPEVAEWAAAKRTGIATGCAVHVDTGMNRLGLTLAEARALAADARLLERIAPSLVMSHLACADTPGHPLNRRQLAAFAEVTAVFPGVPASLANSAGIFLGADYHCDLVRPGIALYGARFIEGRSPLTAVVTLHARVLRVRDLQPGETVGYGATQTARAPTRLAIVGAGYADGYHRAASSSDARPGARAFLRGRHVPIIGRVSMDLVALDVTAVPEAVRGDLVELFGPNLSVDAVAAHAGTIGYELLTGLGRRYERRYVGA